MLFHIFITYGLSISWHRFLTQTQYHKQYSIHKDLKTKTSNIKYHSKLLKY